jgi:membrane protein
MRWAIQLIRRAVADFIDDDCLSSAAAMAYYSIFSLPPLLYLVVQSALAIGVSADEVRGVAARQLMVAIERPAEPERHSDRSLTEEGSESTPSPAHEAPQSSLLVQTVGLVVLLFSATGLFAQLQVILNRAWEVRVKPKRGGLIRIAIKRLFSLGMVLVVAFLVMVSLVLTTLMDDIAAFVQGGTETMVGVAIGFVLNNIAIFLISAVLFAAMFKVLPDATMAWKDAGLGGTVTAVLFVIGKSLIGWYLGRTDFSSGWGDAAVSTLSVLVWIYYTTVVLLFGAELTQVWANDFGHGIAPTDDAERVIEQPSCTPSQ